MVLVLQDGVVFLDEIDKICNSSENRHGADASAEGVQRDLLPLIEGYVQPCVTGAADWVSVLIQLFH